MNNSAMFSGQIQSGLATEMNNAQAADARSNWWVTPVMGELGNMGSNLQQSASDAMQQASSSSGGQGSGGGLLGTIATMFGG